MVSAPADAQALTDAGVPPCSKRLHKLSSPPPLGNHSGAVHNVHVFMLSTLPQGIALTPVTLVAALLASDAKRAVTTPSVSMQAPPPPPYNTASHAPNPRDGSTDNMPRRANPAKPPAPSGPSSNPPPKKPGRMRDKTEDMRAHADARTHMGACACNRQQRHGHGPAGPTATGLRLKEREARG